MFSDSDRVEESHRGAARHRGWLDKIDAVVNGEFPRNQLVGPKARASRHQAPQRERRSRLATAEVAFLPPLNLYVK